MVSRGFVKDEATGLSASGASGSASGVSWNVCVSLSNLGRSVAVRNLAWLCDGFDQAQPTADLRMASKAHKFRERHRVFSLPFRRPLTLT